ncbi:MAG: glycosyl transferase family 2 [Bacteroidia bacterium]|nr:MAG: glycosyl transferase family 2 [Bacteroidia bacterium]
MSFFPVPTNTPEWLGLSVILGAFLFIILTYLRYYLPAIRYKDNFSEKKIPVSVVICAKNEEENLDQNLPHILNQDYPDYEVVIVNDCSIDNTEAVIDKYYQLYPSKIRKVNIPESENYKHGKKMAIFIGIKHAKHEHLVFTDADCRPSSNQWLRIMASHFAEGKEIVLGYGKYDEKEGILNKLVRYDTLTIALQYFSCAIRGNPYMGVGRNLAYTKSLFFRNKGFANHYHVNSGDDDLFVNETATTQNTAVCLHPDAFTISEPPLIFKHWLLQKARHFSTSPLYKAVHQLMLGWIFFSQIFYYIANITLFLILPQLYMYILVSFLLKYIVQTILIYYASKKFNEQKLHWMAFFLEPLLNISYIYIALYKKIKRL